MDVLYRLRPGKRNEPLRYSLRSLANVPHGDVFAVGTAPAWVRNVEVIAPGRYPTKWRALVGDLHLACEQLSGRTLLLVDDDMFVMEAARSVPTLNAGLLLDHLQSKRGSYQRSMGHTNEYLMALGVTKPLSYELHVPMVIDAERMAATLEAVLHWPHHLQARSVYGNLGNLGGKQADDVKVWDGNKDSDLPGGAFLSASPRAWHWMMPKLGDVFATPSEYER